MAVVRTCLVPCCGYMRPNAKLEKRIMCRLPWRKRRLREAWIDRIPGVTMADVTREDRVCEAHFEETDIKKYFYNYKPHKTKNILSPKAVPTLYLDKKPPALIITERERERAKENVKNSTQIKMRKQKTGLRSMGEVKKDTVALDSIIKADATPKITTPTDKENLGPATVSDKQVQTLPLDEIESNVVVAPPPPPLEPSIANKTSETPPTSRKRKSGSNNQREAPLSHEDAEAKDKNTVTNTSLVNPSLAKSSTTAVNEENLTLFDRIRRSPRAHFIWLTNMIPRGWDIELVTRFVNSQLHHVVTFTLEYCGNDSTGKYYTHVKKVELVSDDTVQYWVNKKQLIGHPKFSTKSVTTREDLAEVIDNFDTAKICEGTYLEDVTFSENCFIVAECGFYQCAACRDYN